MEHSEFALFRWSDEASDGDAPAVHPTAVLEPDCEIGEDVAIGPQVVIGAGVKIGAGCRIGAHVVIGAGCSLGEGCLLHPHATLYPGVRLGAGSTVHAGACVGPDGFGYAFVEGAHRKIPQVGTVVAGARVRFGPNSTVDRGSIGDTALGDDGIIGNLVHVGHNVRAGDSLVLEPQAGVAGSAVLGRRVTVGGAVAIVGHLSVGDDVKIARWGGVTHDIPAGQSVSGTPAKPVEEMDEYDRLAADLPSLLDRMRALERAIAAGGPPDEAGSEASG